MKKFRILHHVDRATIAEMVERYAPVFVLSTGRSGSKFIVELLNLSPLMRAFHEPRPTLQYFSDFASRHQDQPEVLRGMIEAARMELVLETFIHGKIFVESNQCLAFFAPALSGLFRSVKFIHLVRHPGDFVASAVRKGWHKNDSIWEAGRVKLADECRWNAMDQVERLGWLWAYTNRFIRDFLSTLPGEQALTCRLEDLLTCTRQVQSLFSFCGSGLPDMERLREVQGRPVNRLWVGADEPDNMKKDPGFPAYDDWPEERKRVLWDMVNETAGGFGYNRLKTGGSK